MIIYMKGDDFLVVAIIDSRKAFNLVCPEILSRKLQACGISSIFFQWLNRYIYYTTQAVRGPITKISQSKCSIAGPVFSKYRTGHCPE